MTVAREILHIANLMASRIKKKNIDPVYYDDYCRKFLKNIASHAFIDTYERGPGYLLFCHLHFLTGKAPYTDHQIMNDIKEWLGPKMDDGSQKNLKPNKRGANFYAGIFLKWRATFAHGHLSYLEYCNDFMRWGTAGGGAKTTYMGETYRTKWAWALANSTDSNGDLKKERMLGHLASLLPQKATIALKEEPSKTREIIATPLSSYLRQCYLLYRRGKCPIHTPLTNPRILTDLEISPPRYFLSIDGERFDHSIPRDFIIDFIRKLGDIDDECRVVAEVEIEHLQTLFCTYKNTDIRWEGGLLSGWRITAILGSIVSAMVAEHIIGALGREDISYIVQGDDIILTSYQQPIDKNTAVELYNSFGLKANLAKTISGNTGEFLKLIHSKNGTWGYPVLGIRSIYYANPWITNFQMTSEEEIAGLWFMVASRLVPHSMDPEFLLAEVQKSAVAHIKQHNPRLSLSDIRDWLRTPTYLGGGGPVEVAGPERSYKSLCLDYKHYQVEKHEIIPSILGVTRLKKELTPNYVRVNPIRMDELYEIALTSAKRLQHDMLPVYKTNVDITHLLFDVAFDRVTGKTIGRFLSGPITKGARMMSGVQLVNWLMMSNDTKKIAPTVSLCHTAIMSGLPSRVLKYLVYSLNTSRATYSMTKMLQAANVYYNMYLSRIFLPYGTH